MDRQLFFICFLTFIIHLIHFQVHRSVPKLLLHGFFKGGFSYVRDAARMPRAGNVAALRDTGSVSASMTALNVAAVALWTVGVFAALYEGVLDPAVRVTSSTLSSIITGARCPMLNCGWQVSIDTWPMRVLELIPCSRPRSC